MTSDVASKLVEAGLVSDEAVRKAQRTQHGQGGDLVGHLVKLGAIEEEDLLRFLSDHYGVPSVNLDQIEIDPEVIRLIPSEVAAKFNVVPISRIGRQLMVAMSNPANFFALDDIKFITNLEAEPFVTTEEQIKRAIDRHYDSVLSMADVMKTMEDDLEVVEQQEAEEDGESQVADIESADQAPVVKFVNSMIAQAVREGASDIHIEVYEKSLRVRFRIDGTLYERMPPPFKLRSAIISRLKIMADLDIAERRVPQDGRIKIRIGKKVVDLRVSCLPCIFGEKIVMRILDKGNLALDLTKLGFQPSALKVFQKAIQMPYGMVLVTGPTGSGKTTTLYSALSKVNTPEVNIMTAEDPVEYNLDGINQVQVNEAVKLTFASALRSFLRQDPNIVMVGEIRDIDTGSIAVKAALTGHLVFSTLHTNDAASTLTRLIDMGVEPFLVASSVNLILAQRLVRRLCENCRKPMAWTEELCQRLQIPMEAEDEKVTLYEPVGCDVCHNTGYKGRLGVYEVLPISPTIRQMILKAEPTSAIKRQAIEEGMLTLRMDGLLKLKSGVTSAEEVLKETAADTDL
ncbi:MAG: type IV-A pilus assembly ATPase PilB [Candidatus Eisenbacteria bacterium]|nr:type IV-A pilus assembly ATPase PilB [Candidatus Eisenbacteria bacterium]